MRDNILNYEDLAQTTDAMREVVGAMVAGFVSDGFTEDQARDLVVGCFRMAGGPDA